MVRRDMNQIPKYKKLCDLLYVFPDTIEVVDLRKPKRLKPSGCGNTQVSNIIVNYFIGFSNVIGGLEKHGNLRSPEIPHCPLGQVTP